MSNPWVRLTNNWLHDASSGLWVAGVIMLAVLQGRQPAMTGAAIEAWEAVAGLSYLLFRMVLISLALVMSTGGLRLAYWRQSTPASEMPQKRPALIGKHVAYFVIYGIGTWWAWTAVWPVR